jgi:hypothetical protein
MIKKIRNNSLFGIQGGVGLFGNSITKKNMNWKQAKARYPRLSPFGDADRDGVKNKFDCHPFDRKRQDDPETENSRPIVRTLKQDRNHLPEVMEKLEKKHPNKVIVEEPMFETKKGMKYKFHIMDK